jgi:hypothetical protein
VISDAVNLLHRVTRMRAQERNVEVSHYRVYNLSGVHSMLVQYYLTVQSQIKKLQSPNLPRQYYPIHNSCFHQSRCKRKRLPPIYSFRLEGSGYTYIRI